MQISHPILKSIIIPKYNITGIKAVDNEFYGKTKLLIIIIFLLVLLDEVFMIYDSIISPIASEIIEDRIALFISIIFLMIFLVYDSLRRSHYSKYIKIDVGKKKIVIYPKNEAEFNGLMEKLE